jgi:hypothetical protein
MKLKPNEYQCQVCGNVYIKGRSDEEAHAEMARRLGEPPPGQKVNVLCDDCAQRFYEWLDSLTPEERAKLDKEARDATRNQEGAA